MIIIDRFEGDIAVLETDSGMVQVSRSCISSDAHEGDVLRTENGVYLPDREATEARRAAVRSKLNMLRRNGNG